jgi:hypothetical protein
MLFMEGLLKLNTDNKKIVLIVLTVLPVQVLDAPLPLPACHLLLLLVALLIPLQLPIQ